MLLILSPCSVDKHKSSIDLLVNPSALNVKLVLLKPKSIKASGFNIVFTNTGGLVNSHIVVELSVFAVP